MKLSASNWIALIGIIVFAIAAFIAWQEFRLHRQEYWERRNASPVGIR